MWVTIAPTNYIDIKGFFCHAHTFSSSRALKGGTVLDRSAISGVAVIDAVVALSLLAMALLAASYPLYQARDAWQQAQIQGYAVELVANAADRIRANATLATSRGMDYADNTLWLSPAPQACAAQCSPKAQMRRDVYQLTRQWSQHHPDARIRVMRCTNALCVVVRWDGYRPQAASCAVEQCFALRLVP